MLQAPAPRCFPFMKSMIIAINASYSAQIEASNTMPDLSITFRKSGQ